MIQVLKNQAAAALAASSLLFGIGGTPATAEWSPARRISIAYATSAQVVPLGRSVFVSWLERGPGSDSRYLLREGMQHGKRWTRIIDLTEELGATSVQLAATGRKSLHVFFEPASGGWTHAMTTNGGVTWTEPTPLGVPGSGYLRVSARKKKLRAVVRDQRKIYFVSSQDLGRTWSTPVLVEADSGPDRLVAIGSRRNLVVVAWHQSVLGRDIVYMRISFDGGRSWSERVRGSGATGGGSAFEPQVAVDGQRAVVVFSQQHYCPSPELEVVRIYSHDGGRGWSQRECITLSDPGRQRSSPIAIEFAGSTLHLLNMRAYSGGIAYRSSSDGGLTFSPMEVTAEGSRRADMAVRKKRVHVVYELWQGTARPRVYYRGLLRP